MSILPTPSSAIPLERRPKLLVVDDQPINIQTLYRMFSQDHQVIMATSGEQAIERCLIDAPDLILLDCNMPGMSGYEVCEALKSNPVTADIPVIFVTANQTSEQETHAFDVGGVDFITKPINAPTVRARVKTHLTLKSQTDTLRQMAFRDGLTGVYNRRYFDDRFQTECQRAAREHTHLSLALIDIDHFKLFNDRYGHQAGDDALVAVAKALQGVIRRPADLLARYGGEEFVCLLPGTDLRGAQHIMEQVISAVDQLRLPHEGSPSAPHLTISAGVSCYHFLTPYPAASLLAHADSQLYLAKHGGRHQAIWNMAPA